MHIVSVARRVLVGAAAATLGTLLFASGAPAVTIPDPGEPAGNATVTADNPTVCPLQRIGTHLVRCDNVVGGTFTDPFATNPSVDDRPATVAVPSDGLNCPLRRVGAHLVRCDYQTGHGTAPSFIPEL